MQSTQARPAGFRVAAKSPAPVVLARNAAIARPDLASLPIADTAFATPPVVVSIAAPSPDLNRGDGVAGGIIEFAKLSVPSNAAVPLVPHREATGQASPSRGGVSSQASAPASSASTAPVVVGTDGTLAQGAIRALSLAPTVSDGVDGRVHPMDQSGGSGGTPPPDKPPTMTGSGGGGGAEQVLVGGVPQPGEYYFPNPVPIGSAMGFFASGIGNGYDVTTNDWSGGTNYSYYMSASPTSTVTGAQTLGTTPNIYGDDYVFIVDASPRAYTITDQVTYANGAHGVSTVTFTSVAPTGSLTTAQVGTQQGALQPVLNTYFVFLGSPGIKINAQASTGTYTAGDFMFLQIVNATYGEATNNGNQEYLKNNVDNSSQPPGQNFNGKLHDTATLSYPLYYTQDPNPGHPTNYPSWSLMANSSTPDPILGTPQIFDQPAFGGGAVAPTKVTSTQYFSTYLMYKPASGGVWIAIDELDWNWTETATKQLDGSMLAPQAQQPNPVPSTPSGAAAFPTWVNTTPNFQNVSMNPLRNGDPGA